MGSPCESCAFREGSETHDREPYNRFRGAVAAMAGIPFFCHHGLDWRKPMVLRKGVIADIHGKKRRLTVCQGWKVQVAKEIKPTDRNKIIRRGLGEAVMETLEAAVGENRKAEKAELWEELGILFQKLLKASKLQKGKPCAS